MDSDENTFYTAAEENPLSTTAAEDSLLADTAFWPSYLADQNDTIIEYDIIPGMNEVKKEVDDIFAYMTDLQNKHRTCKRLRKGVLFIGLPGTGKTLLARAMATKAHAYFLHTTGADMEIMAAQGQQEIANLFECAKQRAPCIIFISKIHLFGLNNSANQAAKKLLCEMDGLARNDKVIVIASTHNLEDLNEEIFHRRHFVLQVNFALPGLSDRLAIICHYLPSKVQSRVNTKKVAKETNEFTGADIEFMVNQAALKAELEGRHRDRIRIEHIYYGMGIISQRKQRAAAGYAEESRQAYHDAGHNFVRRQHKYIPSPQPPCGLQLDGLPQSANAHDDRLTGPQLLAQLDILMSGRVAEEMMLGLGDVSVGAERDFSDAVKLIIENYEKVKRSAEGTSNNHLRYDDIELVENAVSVSSEKYYVQARESFAEFEESRSTFHKHMQAPALQNEFADKKEESDDTEKLLFDVQQAVSEDTLLAQAGIMAFETMSKLIPLSDFIIVACIEDLLNESYERTQAVLDKRRLSTTDSSVASIFMSTAAKDTLFSSTAAEASDCTTTAAEKNPLSTTAAEASVFLTTAAEDSLLADTAIWPSFLADQNDDIIEYDIIPGMNEVKKEVGDILAYMTDPPKNRRTGKRLRKGVLFIGSPGTGKTLLARAMAAKTHAHFFHITGADVDNMMAARGAQDIVNLFQRAKHSAPCVIFIDQFQMVGSKNRANQAINKLILEMDGFARHEGIIVIASTHNLEDLNEEIFRCGNFDVQVTFASPNLTERLDILRYYLQGVAHDEIDLMKLGHITNGFSCADIENMVCLAVLKAINDESSAATESGELLNRISMVHLGAAYERVLERRIFMKNAVPKKEWRRAFHESGHHLVAYCNKNSTALNLPCGTSLSQILNLPTGDSDHVTETQLMEQLEIILSGRVAEEFVYGYGGLTIGSDDDFVGAIKFSDGNLKKMMAAKIFAANRFSVDSKMVIKNVVRAEYENLDVTAPLLLFSAPSDIESFTNTMSGLVDNQEAIEAYKKMTSIVAELNKQREALTKKIFASKAQNKKEEFEINFGEFAPQRVEKRLNYCYGRIEELIITHLREFFVLADALIKYESLTDVEIASVMSGGAVLRSTD